MRILKRKTYYYLQHSFRKDGKVVTKEKYLGKNIPSNIESIKISFSEECKELSLFELFGRIRKAFSKEWKKYPETIKNKIKEELAITFTYNTNAIEGSTITQEETKEIVKEKIAPNKPIADIEETQSHVNVFLSTLNKKEDISIPLILRWHTQVFGKTKPDIAGRFRDYLIKIGDYRAPDWQDVKNLMKELVRFYNSNKNKIHPVELTARIHYRFEKVHPFGDGNGRIGRLIMNDILWWSGYPLLIIEYKKRKSYYRALQKDEDGFFRYFTRRYLTANKKYLKRG